MAQITTLKQMAELVKGGKIKRVAVACGQDPDIIDALARAVNEKLAVAILIGDRKKTEDLAKEHKIDPKIFTLIDEPDYKRAALKAVEMVKKGEADVLMKGLIDTAVYARAYLDKESGLLTGATVSHVGVFETPNYPAAADRHRRRPDPLSRFRPEGRDGQSRRGRGQKTGDRDAQGGRADRHREGQPQVALQPGGGPAFQDVRPRPDQGLHHRRSAVDGRGGSPRSAPRARASSRRWPATPTSW